MTPEETRELIQESADSETTLLGSRTSQLGVEEQLGLRDEKRLTHVLNIGPTGYGKTQLLAHTALQDAYKKHGLCIINPKGDLIDEFIAKLPENRLEDIIYINPGQEPVTSINVLEPQISPGMTAAQKENQKEIIVSDLIDLFRRLSKNWGDQFGRVLETLLRAHLDQNIHQGKSKNLVDVYQCVVEEESLTELIDQTRDSVIREQLVKIREKMTDYEMEPLQRRLNDFIMNPTIRRVIQTDESGFDFREAVNNGKIILVDVQKGEVGGTVSELVGSIVTTQIWAAAQSRINQPENQRNPFYLYIDELQNFAGEGSNFAKILSEAREYRLGCWLATQYLDQLDTEMRRAVTNNCRTKILFNPSGSENLSRLAQMFQGIHRDTLTSLGQYRSALQKPGQQNQTQAKVISTFPPWNETRDNVDQIKQDQTTTDQDAETIELKTSLGKQANAGKEKHQQLLTAAETELESRGFQVDLLYQGPGEEKPDGYVHMPDGTKAHLEAEQSTLTKPAKVLKNLYRAHQQDRETIFAVEQGNAEKLENIVSDPVNRHGNEHRDENGSYSYYTDSQGQPIDNIQELATAEYRILEIPTQQEEAEAEPECPELGGDLSREELQTFCQYRDEDGFCTELKSQCVLQEP
jgi:hypothetical protein